MTSVADLTVRELLAAFRSAEPVPGGGSASALAGAVGASLLAMVGNLPKHRAGPPPDHARIRDATVRATAFADRLLRLTDDDSLAYGGVMASYRLPRETPEEQDARTAAVQTALTGATEVPLEVMRACAAAVKSSIALAELANRNAVSDVQVALELLTAAARGARRNVEINLAGIKDGEYGSRVSAECARLESETDADAATARRHLAG